MRFKLFYIVLMILIPCAGITFLLINRSQQIFEGQELIVLVGILALTISIVSLAIADSNLRKMRVQLQIWSAQSSDRNGFHKCVYRLKNVDNRPLQNFNIQFRYPRNLFQRHIIDHGHRDKFYDMERIVIVINDKYQFIGDGDFVDYEHMIRLNSSASDPISISMVADGYEAKSFTLNNDKKQDVLESSNKSPIIIG
jgi:hypothetical protein